MSAGNVIAFPTVDPSNLTAALRWYADAIERGDVSAESVLMVFHTGVGFLPRTHGLGKQLNRLEVAAVLQQASLSAQAVAFRGAHA